KPAHQLQLVDGFGRHRELIAGVRLRWDAWRKAAEALREAVEDKEKLQAEAERLSWTAEVIDELAPKDGEYKALEAEHARLANAADILGSAGSAVSNLRDGGHNALSLVLQAQQELAQAANYDPAYAPFEKALDEAAALIEDTARDAARLLEHFSLDEGRYGEIDERLSAYWRIARKFRRTPEELFAFAEQTHARLAEIERSADVEGLEAAEAEAKAAFLQAAAELTAARKAAAAKLSAAVTEQMQRLAMAGGRLEIALPACAPWAGGVERAEFLVSGHAGATPRPLTKVASGGELARISLAIAVITAQITPVPTLIFDEVDTGVGGAVAEVVGRLLRKLGETRQVLCVTHLPQVAACAHNQWRVEKRTEDGVTTSGIAVLDAEQRVAETARMLGGLNITDATRATAREMIEGAQGSREP
ncbi:MAG: DNA repair protein RecN, partial [Duodenibacillus sp.]|nr:DNA repair protein RecN [Duodenibacillus sp.]